MKCRAFRKNLHEYLDETLEPGLHAAVQAHLEQCRECRRALQGAQSLGRAVHHALDRAAAPLALTPGATNRIIQAARSQPIAAPARASVWAWLFGAPARTLAAGAMLVVALGLTLQLRRPSGEDSPPPEHHDPASYFVDVPHPIETHEFQVRNGSVIDAVVTHIAVSRLQFPDPPKTSTRTP